MIARIGLKTDPIPQAHTPQHPSHKSKLEAMSPGTQARYIIGSIAGRLSPPEKRRRRRRRPSLNEAVVIGQLLSDLIEPEAIAAGELGNRRALDASDDPPTPSAEITPAKPGEPSPTAAPLADHASPTGANRPDRVARGVVHPRAHQDTS
jgi:hypothetical protein